MARRRIIAGNWKMYKSIPEAVDFIRALGQKPLPSDPTIYLAVPFTALAAAASAASALPIVIGAQNMNDASEGAFTGEIAARMLVDAGARFVVLGHSERRQLFGESSEFINRKVRQALAHGLEPLVCLGETLAQREAGQVEAVLSQMLEESLAGLSREQAAKLILAYEPVWAIGTGRTATVEQAQAAHHHCRELLAAQWDSELAQQVPLLYGGSVRPDNARGLLSQPEIDGLLVGGASLKVETFYQVVDYQRLG
jgi:triosephosphate isomerase (TIM)